MRKLPPRLVGRFLGFASLVTILVTVCLVAPGWAGRDTESHDPQSATTTPSASNEPNTPLPVPVEQEAGATGEVIRRRILSTLSITVLLTTALLLLLWAYVSLRDPLQRRWNEVHLREQRRRERRSRHKRP